MKMLMMALLDTKIHTYGRPFFCRAEGEAIRDVQTACNDESTQLAMYPEDFELRQIGEFDDISGIVDCLPTPKFIVACATLVKIDHRKSLIGDLAKIQNGEKKNEGV